MMLRHKLGAVGTAVFMAAFFLLLLAATNGLFILVPSPVWSFVAFFLFGAYVLALASFLPVSFLLLLPYIFFRGTVMASGVAIEHGGYMSDIETMGAATGAYIRLAGVYIVFITFAACVIEKFYPFVTRNHDMVYARQRTMRHPWVWIFFGLYIAFSLYVLAVGAAKGFPLLTGVDRLMYRDEIGGRLYLLYMGNRTIAALLFGIVFALCEGLRRRAAILLFLSMIVISILFGEKFTSLVLIAIYGAAPLYLLHDDLRRKMVGHFLPAVVAIACVTIPIILAVYGWGENAQQATEMLKSRMVGQGELWFVADRDTDDVLRLDGGDIWHIALGTLSPAADSMVSEPPFTGVMYFMQNYMTPPGLSLFLERSSLTLTFGFEPYLLVVFGWLGMIFPLVFYAGVYALVLLYLGWSIHAARPVSVFIAAKILIWMIVGLAQGYLYMIFGFKVLLMIVAAAMYEIVSAFLSRSRTRRYA